MRILTSIVIVTALVVCFGCANEEPAPVEQPEVQVDSEPIAEEGFESGDVGDTMTVGEEEETETEEESPSH